MNGKLLKNGVSLFLREIIECVFGQHIRGPALRLKLFIK